jgi:hypothetical protein
MTRTLAAKAFERVREMKTLLTTAAVLVALVNPAAAQVKDDAFIFGSNSIVSALDAKQSIRLGERLTLAQIKKRLPSYTVKKSNACEGSCVHVSGRNGIYLELDYNTPGEPISYISGFLVGARDTLGHVGGMSLIKAIGSNRATCDLGMTTTCASRSIKNLSYEVNEDRCSEDDKLVWEKDPPFQHRLAECMTVDGMFIHEEKAF